MVVPPVSMEAKTWNTTNLHYRIGVDVAAAAASATLVAPIVTIIDR
jgi:hypothetical protein